MPRSGTLDVLPIFRTERQAQLLRLLLLQPEREFKQTELADLLGDLQQTVGKELKRLVGAGVVDEKDVGAAKFYRAAVDSPFYEHLRALVELALGPEVELRQRLSAIEGVDFAAIFGSWARGTKIRPTSDIDVLVIGEVKFEEVADAAAEVEEMAGREIQVVALTWDEFDHRLAADSGFVTNVINGPMKPLVGDLAAVKERKGVNG